MLDLEQAEKLIATAFARDLEDGTVDILSDGTQVTLDGGNWSLQCSATGAVQLSLPADNPNYFDPDAEVFLDNVWGLEVEQSLQVLDKQLGGVITSGLRGAHDPLMVAAGNRLARA